MIEVIRFVNSRFGSNTYIISHSKHNDVWLIDPGDTDVIFKWMKNQTKQSITGVLLTHAHFDHIYGLNDIVTHYPICDIYIANEYGNEALHNDRLNGSKYTEEGPIVVANNAQIHYYSEIMQLWDDTKIQTINTPGHSDDSQCILIDDMLFTGDTLIKDVRTVTKLKGGSVQKLEESIKIFTALKGNNLKVMPGHGEEFELDEYDLNKMNFNPLNCKSTCQQK